MAQILNLDRLLSKFENLYETDLVEPLTKACLLVENEAKIKCPVDTGQLRQSITHQVEGNTGVIGTNVEYAPYVEYGTGKYASGPYEGKGRQTPWAFIDPKTGDLIWTAGQKPANNGKGFLEPALLENEEKILKLIEEEIKKGVRKNV